MNQFMDVRKQFEVKSNNNKTSKNRLGFLLIFIGGIVIFANEGRSIEYYKTLAEAEEILLQITPDLDLSIIDDNNGRLVHFTGKLIIDEPIIYNDYGISVEAVQLRSSVEMYQWGEVKTSGKKTGDVYKDYTYYADWKDTLIHSKKFKIPQGHQNPNKMHQNVILIAPSVKVGELILGEKLKSKFTNFVSYKSNNKPQEGIQLSNGFYYHGNNIWEPKVGDYRVEFYKSGSNDEIISVVGMIKDGVILPFPADDEHEILFLFRGSSNSKQMFSNEQKNAQFVTTQFRIVGIGILFGAMFCFTDFLKQYMNSETTPAIIAIAALSLGTTFIGMSWKYYN